MSMNEGVFTPCYESTVSIAATTSSSSTSISNFGTAVLVSNNSAEWVFVEIGSGTASAADCPVAPGSQILLNRSPSQTTVSAITAASTATVYFTPGYGN